MAAKFIKHTVLLGLKWCIEDWKGPCQGANTQIGREQLSTSASRSNLRTPASSVRWCNCASEICILRNNRRAVTINVDCDYSTTLHLGTIRNSLLLHSSLTTLYEKRKNKHPKMKKWDGKLTWPAPERATAEVSSARWGRHANIHIHSLNKLLSDASMPSGGPSSRISQINLT